MTTRRKFAPSGWGLIGVAAAMAIGSTLVHSPAGAAPGDYAYAHAQFLQGDVLGTLDTDELLHIAGEEALSNGLVDDGPYYGDLDLTVLGAIPLQLPGGIQVPLVAAEVGKLGQYAYTQANAASLAAAGAITEDGVIGTGLEPNDDPGALTLDLENALQGVIPPNELTSVLADVVALDLVIDGVSARAEQVAPGAPVGTYSIADVELVLQSQALGSLLGTVEAEVMGDLEDLLATLEGEANSFVAGVVAELPDDVISVDVELTGLDQVATALGELSTLDAPGIHIDLLSGTITLDIDELVELNGRPAGTVVLTPEVLGPILANVGTLLGTLTNEVDTALGSLGVAFTINIAGQGSLINLPINLGSLLGGGLGNLLDPLLPDELDSLVADISDALGVPLGLVLDTGLSTIVGLVPLVIEPLLGDLQPLFDGLAQIVRLTVNVQESTTPIAGFQAVAAESAATQFTERALRVELLPGTVNLARLDLANATVGPNTLATQPTTTTPTTTSPATTPPCVITVTQIDPPAGSAQGGTIVTITGAGFDSATAVTFGVVAALEFTAINDTTIEAVAPAHASGSVTVTVSGAAQCTAGTIGFEFVAPEVPQGTSTTTTLPPPGEPTEEPTVVTLPATGRGSAGGTAVVATAALGLGAGLVLIARRRAAASAAA